MYLLFDIGGTNMRLAVSEDGQTINTVESVPTPLKYEEGIAKFVETARKLVGDKKIDMIVGGMAGPINRTTHSFLNSPNLPDWVGRSFGSDITAELGASVLVQNDASMAALGEALLGAGRGFNIVAYITIGTGVGGARIVDGKIDRTSIGFEPGHQIVDIDQTVFPKAEGKMLEDYISGSAVYKIFGKKPKEMNDPVFWDGMAKILAYGLANNIVHWSPDVIVLGGSMINGDPAIPIDATVKYLHEVLKIYPTLPVIKKSELGDQCGLFGALEYAKSF